MIRILLGMSGSGKTYKLKEEIAHKQFDVISNAKQVYIIEREQYQEYSNIFNSKFIHVLKPSSDISFLEKIENSEIYIDCENYEDKFMRKIAFLAKRARAHNNDITITFLECWEKLSDYEKIIYMNSDVILIGKCCLASESRVEEILGTKIRPLKSKYDFRTLRSLE